MKPQWPYTNGPATLALDHCYMNTVPASAESFCYKQAISLLILVYLYLFYLYLIRLSSSIMILLLITLKESILYRV